MRGPLAYMLKMGAKVLPRSLVLSLATWRELMNC